MDKKEAKIKSKHKTTLRSLLSRKSTKIEPENNIIDNDIIEIESSTSAGSSLREQGNLKNILINKNKMLDESNSIKVASNSANSTPTNQNKTYNYNNNNKNNINNNNNNINRLSSQFTFCCSNDLKSMTPPDLRNINKKEVELKADIHTNNLNENNPIVKITDTNNISEEINGTVPKIQNEELLSLSPPQEIFGERLVKRPLVVCEKEFSEIDDIKRNSILNPVLFNEYQPSIAMQSCRSRLREKLLPPGINSQDIIEQQRLQEQQHFSSPNILSTVGNFENRSNSIDNLIETPIIRRPVASTNSLVRQSLMAAHVLNLIPTEKARERNFLQGRLGVVSLLGRSELERVLPSKEVKIFVGTWNMNGQNPPKQMNDFVLPCGIEHVPDIITIGTQESCSERFEWEVILQETLGSTHILLHSTSLGTLHLAVFIHRDLIWFCSIPEDDCLSVRAGSAFRTKGAVAISFSLFGTSMLFVTSHLTAHQDKIKERVQDIKRITHALDLPRNLPIKHKNKDVTQNFDSVYWCGDLNFRLSEPREKLLQWIKNTKFPLPSHLPHGYMHTDQLTNVLSDGAAFKGFKEANITFPPTYKYDPGTQQFDSSSKQRAPAYTDRILYKYKQPQYQLGIRRNSAVQSLFVTQTIECISYDSVPSMITSDHKPVWGLFINKIRPGIDTIPLAAGLFNREVYLEGMRRRIDNTDASSTVCSIQ